MNLRPLTVAFAALVFNVHANAHTDTVRMEIERQEAQWAATFASGDIPALAAMYEAQAWLIVPGAEPFQGRGAIHGALTVFKETTRWMNLRTVTVASIAHGYAIENGIAESLAPGAGASLQRASYQVIWHKTPKGDWKIVRDTVTPLHAEKAEAAASIPSIYPNPIIENMCTPGKW